MNKKLFFTSAVLMILGLGGCSSSPGKPPVPDEPSATQKELSQQEDAQPEPGKTDDAIAQAVGEAEQQQPSKQSNSTATSEMYKRFNQARLAHQSQAAIEAAGEILARNPGDVKVLNGLALMYMEMGKLDAAKLNLSRALLKSPNDPALHNNAGLIELKSHNLRQALNEFKKAIQTDSRNRAAHANLGVVYLQYRNYAAAAQELGIAVSGGDQRPEILSDYGFALRGIGEYDKALSAYEKASEKDTRNISIMLNFAILLVEHANRPKRALKVLNKIRMVATEPAILEKANLLAKKAEAATQGSQEKEISVEKPL